jgi:2-phosphosulfolactate phosphatase
MRVDVAFSPAGLAAGDVAGRTVFVIDVLRSSTTICAALANGARGVVPVPGLDEAMKLAQTLERTEVLLAGERNLVRISGFDRGNSPREMTEDVVRGRTLIMTTTNGTRALLATGGAAAVYLAAPVNLTLAARAARAALAEHDDLLLLCAGREGGFSLDDAFVAGRLLVAALARRRPRRGLNDAAMASIELARRWRGSWLRPLLASRSGRDLAAQGFREDVVAAATTDAWPVLPRFADRRITAVPEPAAGDEP